MGIHSRALPTIASLLVSVCLCLTVCCLFGVSVTLSVHSLNSFYRYIFDYQAAEMKCKHDMHRILLDLCAGIQISVFSVSSIVYWQHWHLRCSSRTRINVRLMHLKIPIFSDLLNGRIHSFNAQLRNTFPGTYLRVGRTDQPIVLELF